MDIFHTDKNEGFVNVSRIFLLGELSSTLEHQKGKNLTGLIIKLKIG